VPSPRNFFSFFTFFHLNFAKICGWHCGGGGRDLPRCPTVAPPTAVGHGGRGPDTFQKFVIFCLNSNEGKIYMKIVAFDEIYNFVV
jgi:hypothetical protein